ncbi:MAG: glycosyltransferase family 2 protein [Desulfomonilaceae bacterium]
MRTPDMKISVVTVSYNQARFLERTIKSVVSQDYENIEYIIVDPGSTDGSRDIIRDNAGLFSKIVFEPDSGPADGLNKGFSFATGDIFYYLNSDDVALPGAFSTVVDYFRRFDSADVIYGHGIMIDERDIVTRRLFSRKWHLKSSFFVNNIVQQATFIRKRMFKAVKGFNHLNTTCWDFELLVDIAIAGGNFIRVDDALGAFRMYSDSISGSQRLSDLNKTNFDRIAQKILGRPLTRFDPLAGLYHKSLNRVFASKFIAYHLADMVKLRMGLSLGNVPTYGNKRF